MLLRDWPKLVGGMFSAMKSCYGTGYRLLLRITRELSLRVDPLYPADTK